MHYEFNRTATRSDSSGRIRYLYRSWRPNIMAKSSGVLVPLYENKIMPDESEQLVHQVYDLDGKRSMEKLLQTGDDDFSFSLSHVGRFRCNAYKQRSSIAAVVACCTL